MEMENSIPTTDEEVKAQLATYQDEFRRMCIWDLYQVRRQQDQSILRAWTCTLYSVIGETAPAWAEEL